MILWRGRNKMCDCGIKDLGRCIHDLGEAAKRTSTRNLGSLLDSDTSTSSLADMSDIKYDDGGTNNYATFTELTSAYDSSGRSSSSGLGNALYASFDLAGMKSTVSYAGGSNAPAYAAGDFRKEVAPYN